MVQGSWGFRILVLTDLHFVYAFLSQSICIPLTSCIRRVIEDIFGELRVVVPTI